MSQIKALSTLANQWYRLRSYAHRKNCEEIIREYKYLERAIGLHKAESAQEALTQLRIAVLLWQENAIKEDATDFLKNRRSALYSMFDSALDFLSRKADGESI